MRRTGLIIFAYALLAFAVCLAVSFAFQDVPELLPGEKTDYLVINGLIYFFKLSPALILCGFLVGCSISYGQDSAKAKIKYSKAIMVHFRKTMIASIVLVFAISMITEVFLPICQNRQHLAEIKPSVFDEYVTLADSYYSQKKWEEAYEYSSNALRINPNDRRAQWLKEHSEAELKSLKGVDDERIEPKFVYVPLEESNGETVASLIKKAKSAEEKKDWFNAHYYAYMAVNIGNERDTNFEEAQRLASEAWNQLFKTDIFEESEEQLLFRKKREAYLSLINGDNAEAYYKFLEISQANDLAARDPDVVQFLKIAEERVSNQCFFIEETKDLKRFETSNDIYFAITHDDGAKDVVFIKGITPVKDSGKMIQYLRGFKMMSFDKDGQFRMSLAVPYVKMLSVKTETFDDKTKEEFDIKDSFKNVPYLMLEGISRTDRNSRISPVFEFDAALGKKADDLKNYFILGLSVNDFNALCDAGIGSGEMSLASLAKLLPKVHDFGFSSEIYSASFLNRVTYPLFMLFVFMFFACASWNYRLDAPIFKFKWIFIMPFISMIIYALLELVLYALKLLNFVLVSFTGNFAIIISVAILVILFFIASLSFIGKTA